MKHIQPRKRDAGPLKSATLKSATPSHRRTWNASAKHIELLCREIASNFHPDKIILFGSRAYGNPRSDSDVDLLIVMPYKGSPFKQAGVIINHLINTVGIVPIDVLVRTSKEVQARIRMGDRFISEIMKRGRVMYEANHQ
jgi:predicted nucleotidyltransferase